MESRRCDLEWRAAHENRPLLITVMMFICVTRRPDTLFPLTLFLRNPKSKVKVCETPMHLVKSSALDYGEWYTSCSGRFTPGLSVLYLLNGGLGRPNRWSGRFGG